MEGIAILLNGFIFSSFSDGVNSMKIKSENRENEKICGLIENVIAPIQPLIAVIKTEISSEAVFLKIVRKRKMKDPVIRIDFKITKPDFPQVFEIA